MSDARALYMQTVGARYSALVSWTREILHVDYATGERIVAAALKTWPGLISGHGKPSQMTEIAKAAAGNLAERELAAQDAADQIG